MGVFMDKAYEACKRLDAYLEKCNKLNFVIPGLSLSSTYFIVKGITLLSSAVATIEKIKAAAIIALSMYVFISSALTAALLRMKGGDDKKEPLGLCTCTFMTLTLPINITWSLFGN